MTFVPTPEMLADAEDEFDQFEVERQFGMASDLGKHWLDRERNRILKESLAVAAEAEKWIPGEQDRLRTLLEEAIDRGADQVEIESREYQIWYVGKYLTRAADIARTREAYFRTLKTKEDIQREQKLCSENLDHWFRFYAWGYDPRARTPLSIVPFELYPRQLDLVNTLEDIVFHRKTSLAIEKARDEGATELIVRWAVHRWNYREGFSMLLSSRTEDEVDTKKKLGTLFERARFQIRRLPDWMLHPEFDLNKNLLPDKLIASPNGNALHGTAPTQDMGRGDRVTAAMLDEFAFWRFGGYPQWTALSQTTDSVLMPSSVAGIFNQFADLTHDGVTPKFEMDWRDNPFKDERWYNSLRFGYIAPKMTSTAIAQEVDRNYRASQPGKVWQCPEPYVFITWSEFLRPFVDRGLALRFDNGGHRMVPRDWGVTRTNDFGKSEGHDWAHLVGAQPKQGYGLEDTHFIFLARNLEPTGLTTEQAVAQWRMWEAQLGLRDRTTLGWTHGTPARNWNSHEQDELRQVLIATYGENWMPWDTDYETGITTIEDWWTVVDKHEPNPFRPELMGRCRLVFVAPDGEYEMAFNERLGQYFVTTSVSEFGFSLARKQIDAYHYPQAELGKPVQKMRPKKEFDDIIDTIRGYSVNWNRDPIPYTRLEAREAALPDNLKNLDTIIATMTPENAERAMVARQMAFQKMDEADDRRKAAASRSRPQVPRIGMMRGR